MITNIVEKAKGLKEEYKNNKPFEHIKIDDMFPKPLLDDLVENIKNTDYEWYKLCTKGPGDFGHFGKSAEVLTEYLTSSDWVDFLRELTDIEDLISDKEWLGAGINFEPRGSHLEPHTDFNKNNSMWRRVNVLLFLSKDWKDEWGGHNELGHLGNDGVYVVDKKYRPDFNRVVIFNTSPYSYHGFDLVSCPEDEARIVISCYYYSKNSGDHKQPNFTTNYVGWDKSRREQQEYQGRRGTGWRKLK
tara:strand:+ start:99 stop:833 length:735 start_codon:yes stop_codon:yes gene_type:complete